jgi:hypothetical protein
VTCPEGGCTVDCSGSTTCSIVCAVGGTDGGADGGGAACTLQCKGPSPTCAAGTTCDCGKK